MQVNLKPIGEILKSNYLEAPPFQRPYAWGGDNIKQLLEDVGGNLGKEEYFIGTIVTSVQEKESAPLRVIDGQQRLATVSIMLAAVRDRMNEIDGSGESAAQLLPFLMERNLATKARSPKLKMSDQDNSFFRGRFIDRDAVVSPKYESHKRLEGAYSLVYSAIAEMPELRLGEWGDFIESRLKVIHIEADPKADAIALFEAVNDSESALTQSDLVGMAYGRRAAAGGLRTSA